MKQKRKRSVPVVPSKPRECLSESALFLENLQNYYKITWPLTQGQYKGGKVASFALRRSQEVRFPKM
jgi:hypothetical protein